MRSVYVQLEALYAVCSGPYAAVGPYTLLHALVLLSSVTPICRTFTRTPSVAYGQSQTVCVYAVCDTDYLPMSVPDANTAVSNGTELLVRASNPAATLKVYAYSPSDAFFSLYLVQVVPFTDCQQHRTTKGVTVPCME